MSPGCCIDTIDIIGQQQVTAISHCRKCCKLITYSVLADKVTIDGNNLKKVIPRLLVSSVNRCVKNDAEEGLIYIGGTCGFLFQRDLRVRGVLPA